MKLPILAFTLSFFFTAALAQTSKEIEIAQQLFQKRDLTAARKHSLLLVQSSNSLLARYYLGRIALLELKPVEAISWLEPPAAARPPILDSVEQLAKAYFDAGNFEKAKEATERAIQLTPWNGALRYRLGRIYQHLGDLDASRREFTNSVRLKTKDRESVEKLLLGSGQLTSGQKSQAVETGRALFEDASVDPDVLVAFGLNFAGAGMQAEAEKYFHKAADRDVTFQQAQFNTGLALLKLNRPSEASRFLIKARQLAPESIEATAGLALAYFAQAKYSDALPVLESWLRLASSDLRAATMLGLSLMRTGDPAKAVSVLKEVTRKSPRDPKPYLLLIEALNGVEQQDDALRTADEALSLFPDAPQVNLAKAQQLARLGRYREAGPAFERASALAPDQNDALLGLAEAKQKQGEYSASLEVYRRVLASDKTNLTANLGAARSLVQLTRTSEARALLEDAVASNQENQRLHYELSGVYARMGEGRLAAEQTRILETLRRSPAKTP